MQSRLSAKQVAILEFLHGTADWTTRQQMEEKTGKKGFSKALGAPTMKIKPGTLEALGLVERRDMTKPFAYRLTESGRQRFSCDNKSKEMEAPNQAMVNVESADLTDAEIEEVIRNDALFFPALVPTAITLVETRQRRGQDALRRLTLQNYADRCAVCDVSDARILRASHIIGWAECEETRGYLGNVIGSVTK
ncbi:hypothetical protein [Crenobacter cavernae]|uniref:hypothetical protein n=1 Tax=Crenobacter cavernae TaxID=2290923 RepID=UPI00100EDCDF|nr:hypothetical protein [Crenobacter cavernae]